MTAQETIIYIIKIKEKYKCIINQYNVQNFLQHKFKNKSSSTF